MVYPLESSTSFLSLIKEAITSALWTRITNGSRPYNTTSMASPKVTKRPLYLSDFKEALTEFAFALTQEKAPKRGNLSAYADG